MLAMDDRELTASPNPFPPGRPSHFFIGVAAGLSPWVIVWFVPIGAAVLSAVVVLTALGLLFGKTARSYGCGSLVAVIFGMLALALLTVAGLRPI
jgi:hypothetical protein